MVSNASNKTKAIFIAAFVLFGFLAGLPVGRHDNLYDTPLFINLPGYYLGELFQSMWRWFDTLPWILRFPQLYVLASVIAWGLIGVLLAFLFKPRTIIWIAGIYLFVFGGFTAAYFWL